MWKKIASFRTSITMNGDIGIFSDYFGANLMAAGAFLLGRAGQLGADDASFIGLGLGGCTAGKQ